MCLNSVGASEIDIIKKNMQQIQNLSEVEGQLKSYVTSSASYESYVDLDDPEHADVQIERWVSPTRFVECDIRIRQLHRDIFDPSEVADFIRTDLLPRKFYFRQVNFRHHGGESYSETIHLPGGLEFSNFRRKP